jgi:hypothetical protein
MTLWAEHAEDEADEFDRQRALSAELDTEIEEAFTHDAAAETKVHVDPTVLNGNGYHGEVLQQSAQGVGVAK